ncbi:MAG: peptidylprolyl isomerase [Flavobacteriales bacterium]
MKKNLSLLLLLVVTFTAVSQKKKDILFTINQKPVLVSEFKNVYQKNLNLVLDENQKGIDSYLDLFIDYKLKVEEAYAQKLNEQEAYKKEFDKYENQLAKKYLFETELTEDMAIEAYERGLEEVNADHLLLRVDYDALPKDTLAAYQKISKIKERALAGEDFTTLVKTESEEPGAKQRGGKLGYFSVFYMVYPFETAAYNTPVGTISDIVRTKYGYHILKVNDRRKKEGDIKASHIMISTKIKDRNFNPKERIFEIYAKLKQGASFDDLAKKYSDDKNSAKNGGRLKRFNRGVLRSKPFEDKAYQLKEIGQISEPIETKFGWHIIRLDEKFPIKTYEESKEEIYKKIKEGDRLETVLEEENNKIKNMYVFHQDKNYLPFFMNYVSDSILKRKWNYKSIPTQENKELFTIGNKSFTYDDFAQFINERQRLSRPYRNKEIMIKDYQKEFVNKNIRAYFKKNLEKTNPEYASVINEYRNGLLIYDVMNKNIWEKAKNDSIGLIKYYEKNKENYKWKQRVDAIIINTTDKKIAQQAKMLLENNKSEDEIKKTLNKDGKINVIISSGKFEKGSRELPKNLEPKVGNTSIYEDEGNYSVIKINEVIPSQIKDFEQVKGKVISSYQNELEKKWIQELKNKYNVVINNKALKKLKKEFNK